MQKQRIKADIRNFIMAANFQGLETQLDELVEKIVKEHLWSTREISVCLAETLHATMVNKDVNYEKCFIALAVEMGDDPVATLNTYLKE